MKLMRTIIPIFLLLAFFALPGATPSARAQAKIATVNMKKLLDGYWKTKQANVVLDNRKADLRKELKDMTDGMEKNEADYKQLMTQAEDPSISDMERDRRKQAAADKYKQISDNKSAYDQFSRQAEVQLQEQVQRMTSNLVADITAAVGSRAKAAGYTMVLNYPSDSVIYSNDQADITPDVLAQLNAGAPIDVSSPGTNDTTAPMPGRK